MKRYPTNTSVTIEKTDELHCVTALNTAVQTPHEIKVIIAVDNLYKLTVDGQTIPVDPKYGWSTINTHKFTVAGEGPWVVAVDGIDVGYASGFLGAVYVDDVLKAASGTTDPGIIDFKTILNPSAGWNQSASFDDSLWSIPAVCNINPWGGWLSTFRSLTKSNASVVWLESCWKVWITAYFRVVVSA